MNHYVIYLDSDLSIEQCIDTNETSAVATTTLDMTGKSVFVADHAVDQFNEKLINDTGLEIVDMDPADYPVPDYQQSRIEGDGANDGYPGWRAMAEAFYKDAKKRKDDGDTLDPATDQYVTDCDQVKLDFPSS